MNPPPDKFRSPTYRWITGIFGGFLVAIALVIVLFFDGLTHWPAMLAALCCGVFGADAVLGALRNRVSLLERLGPLP